MIEGIPITLTGGPSHSSNTVPIATSTPVNIATAAITSDGIVSMAPPPLVVNSTVRASYPAVLKGRSGATPPLPNLVPSGKVPPPVPPRGSAKRADEQRGGNVSSSSSTSGRGDFNNAHKLHDDEFTMRVQRKNSNKQPQSLLHVPTSRVHAYGYSVYSPSSSNSILQYERDEFVSVEKIDDSYVIKTSPYPFRPYRRKNAGGSQKILVESLFSTGDVCEDFLTPQYKMSRKDKKHSDTYAERMRNKPNESIVIPKSFINQCSQSSIDRPNLTKVQIKKYKMKKVKKQVAPQPLLRKQVSNSISRVSKKKDNSSIYYGLGSNNTKFPDTLNTHQPDNQYLCYSKNRESITSTSLNTSFLHGYNTGRPLK